MKKLLMGVAALPFLASIAMAGESIVINDSQMDRVTAGHNQFFGGITIHYPDYYGSPGSTCGGGPGCIPAGSTPDNPGHPGAATILGPVGPTPLTVGVAGMDLPLQFLQVLGLRLLLLILSGSTIASHDNGEGMLDH